MAELSAWWDRLKGNEAPVIEPLGEEEPLPYDGILVRLRARMAATPVCPPLPPPAPLVDVESMTVEQLDSVLAVAAARRNRLMRQEAEQEASFSMAAAEAADDAAGLA